MKTLLFILLPFMGFAQTYQIEAVYTDGSYYPSSGHWSFDKETFVVQNAGRMDLYTVTGVLDPNIPNSYRCTKGSSEYGVGWMKTKEGLYMLIVKEKDGYFDRTYIGKLVKPRK